MPVESKKPAAAEAPVAESIAAEPPEKEEKPATEGAA
jgi:hypothetical protein